MKQRLASLGMARALGALAAGQKLSRDAQITRLCEVEILANLPSAPMHNGWPTAGCQRKHVNRPIPLCAAWWLPSRRRRLRRYWSL